MKCKERLCSSTKNIKQSGFCNICDDLMEKCKKRYEAIEEKRTFPRIDIDLKLLIYKVEEVAAKIERIGNLKDLNIWRIRLTLIVKSSLL